MLLSPQVKDSIRGFVTSAYTSFAFRSYCVLRFHFFETTQSHRTVVQRVDCKIASDTEYLVTVVPYFSDILNSNSRNDMSVFDAID